MVFSTKWGNDSFIVSPKMISYQYNHVIKMVKKNNYFNSEEELMSLISYTQWQF